MRALFSRSAGPFGCLNCADARPNFAKAIVAVEPSGPPFEDAVLRQGAARAWGRSIGRGSASPGRCYQIRNRGTVGGSLVPITYDPPITDQSEIKTAQQEALVRDRLASF